MADQPLKLEEKAEIVRLLTLNGWDVEKTAIVLKIPKADLQGIIDQNPEIKSAIPEGKYERVETPSNAEATMQGSIATKTPDETMVEEFSRGLKSFGMSQDDIDLFMSLQRAQRSAYKPAMDALNGGCAAIAMRLIRQFKDMEDQLNDPNLTPDQTMLIRKQMLEVAEQYRRMVGTNNEMSIAVAKLEIAVKSENKPGMKNAKPGFAPLDETDDEE